MIRKLKIRIVVVIMVIVTMILSLIGYGIYLYMYRSEKRSNSLAIDYVMSMDLESNDKKNKHSENDSSPEMDFGVLGRNVFFAKSVQDPHNAEMNSHLRAWISVSGKDRNSFNIIYSNPYFETDESTVSTVAGSILSSENDEGYVTIDEAIYRYRRMLYDSEKYRIVLLDLTNQMRTMKNLEIITILCGIFAWVVMFVLSCFLSIWVSKPIENAWNKEKEFFTDASHELKTPLTVIGANLDVIRANPENKISDQLQWFDYIETETKKMSTLISSMLYLAREDRTFKTKKSDMVEIDVSEITEGACLTFDAFAFEKGRNLEWSIEPDIKRKGEKDTISRLVHILIDNAVSHSDDGGKIDVRLDEYHGKARLTVSNTGERIPPKDIPRLFDRFYRVDKSRTSETGGFGLGLAIAKSIAVKHRGSLDVVSADDGLTTFTFVF